MSQPKKMTKKDEPFRTRNVQTLIRLTEKDKRALVALADDWGLSQTDVVMLLVRDECKRRGIKVP